MLPPHSNSAERIVRVICLMLCVAFFAEQGLSQRSPTARRRAPQQVQPYDPLTPEEKDLAARVASNDSRVKESLGSGRQRMVAVGFVDGGDPSLGRHAEVIFIRYDNNQGVVAIVNLKESSVTKVMTRSGVSVPLSTEEVDEALSLALQNSSIVTRLGADASRFRSSAGLRAARSGDNLHAYISSTTPEGDSCRNRRCIVLVFNRNNRSLIGDSVVVADLTNQRAQLERSRR